MTEDKEAVSKEKKKYTYNDLIRFSNTDIYSGFGDVKESIKPSAPRFSFGTSTRYAQPKKYQNKQLAWMDCFGKSTPKGPNYNVHDKFAYDKAPEHKIGTTIRNTLDTKAKYDHYFRKDVDIDTNEADKVRRKNIGNIRFGGASRFPIDEKKYKITPGPQYQPPIKPEASKSPQYSLYARRAVKGFDPLIQLTSTTQIVGPASYHPQNSMNPSNKTNLPNWSVPKGPRDPSHKNRWQLNQTYDLTSSVGTQARSDKETRPQYSLGKRKRDQKKSGTFSTHMQRQPMSVRLQHPRF